MNEQVENETRGLANTVTRTAGPDRFATSVESARDPALWNRSNPCSGSPQRFTLADGITFQSALIASGSGGPILLTNGAVHDVAGTYLSGSSGACTPQIAILSAGEFDADAAARSLADSLGRAPALGSRDRPYPAGTPGLTDHARGIYEFTVLSYDSDAGPEATLSVSKANGANYIPPPAGSRYVTARLRIANRDQRPLEDPVRQTHLYAAGQWWTAATGPHLRPKRSFGH